MCVTIADDMELFDVFTDRTPSSVPVKELAALTWAEEGLIL